MTSFVVSSGQTSSGLTLSSGDTLTVQSGGTASATNIDFGGIETISAGGLDVAATLSGSTSGSAQLTIGGTASGTIIDAFGNAVVAGGLSVSAIVNSGGVEIVSSGAANATVVNGGGLLELAGGGATASGALIGSGGSLLVVAGSVVGAIIDGGGRETVSAGGFAGGTVIAGGGSASVLSGGIASGTVIAGGLLDLAAGAVASGSIAFAGSGGTLEIDGATMPAAVISNFAAGDAIDLRALAWSATNSVGFAAGTLTVSGGGVTDTLALSGIAPGSTFSVTSDGFGGTIVTETAPPSTQWSNTSGGDWTVAANWSAGVPTASVDATLPALAVYYAVTLTAAGAARSLTIGGGNSVLEIDTTSGALPASLAVQGNLDNRGGVYVDQTFGAGGSTLTVGGTLSNTDYMTIGASFGNFAAVTTVTAAGLANTGYIYLYGGTGTAANQAVFDITSGTAPASNTGGLELFYATSAQIQGDFDNSGYLYLYSNGSGTADMAVGGTLTNTGSITIDNQNTSGTSTLTVGDLVGSGTIDLAGATGTSTGQATLDITAAAPAVLAGTIDLSGDALLEFASGSIAAIGGGAYLLLNGANAFIADAGATGSNSALALASNDGTLDLENGAATTAPGDFSNTGNVDVDIGYAAGGSVLAIAGTLSNSGNLQIGTASLNMSATATVSAADLVDTGTITLYGGTGTDTNQATLDITSGTAPTLLTGHLNLTGRALVEFAGGSIAGIAGNAEILLNGPLALVADAGAPSSNSALTGLANNAGTLDLEGGVAVAVTGNLDNSGVLRLDANGASGGSTLAVAGTLTNTNTLQIGTASFDLSAATTVSAAAFADDGSLYLYGGTGTDTNQATLDITAGSAPAVLTGAVNLYGEALLEFASGGISSIAATGTLLLDGPHAFLADAVNPTSNGALSALASNDGRVDEENAVAIAAAGNLNNAGQFELDINYAAGGSTLAVGGTLNNAGTLQIGTAYENLSASTTVTAAGLTNVGYIYLYGGTGSDTNQAVLDIAGSATDWRTILLQGDAVLSAASLTVVNGGTVTVSGGTASGVSIGTAGREIINSGGTGVAPTIAGGILELAGGTVSGGIVFAGGGTLQIDGATMPTNAIGGFAFGDAIDLRALAFGSTTGVSYASSTQLLTVSGGGVTDTLTLSGVPAGTVFVAADDGSGGTVVTETLATGGTQWINSGGGDWTVSANWSAGVPTSSTDAAIGVAGGYTVSLTANGVANSLTIDHAGVTFELYTPSVSGAPASLAVQGNLTNSGGFYVDTAGAGGSMLTVGGTLTTTNVLELGNGSQAASPTLSATSVDNTGALYLDGATSAGAVLVTTGDFSNSYVVYVDEFAPEGNSRLNVGGALDNTDLLYIGNNALAGPATVTAAALVNTGSIYLSGGVGSDTNQATLDITASPAPAVLTGNFSLGGHSLLEFTSGSVAEVGAGASLTLFGASAFVADAGNTGANGALSGLASNDGYLELDSGAAINISGDFVNDSSLYVDYLYYNTSGGSSLAVAGTLSNAGALYIGQYANQAGLGTTVTAAGLANTGSITLHGGTGTNTVQATLDITGAPAPATLTGTVDLFGHALLEFTSGSVTSIANGAYLLLGGVNAVVADAGSLSSNSALGALGSTAGTFELDNGAAVQTAGDFANDGTVYVDYFYYNTSGGSSLTVGGTLSNAGTLFIGQYAFQAGSGSTVTAAGLANTGTVALTGGSGTDTVQATLDISAAAPTTLTGTFQLYGHALLEFASGSVTATGKGASLLLNGANAVVADVGNTGSSSALVGLASNAGSLYVENGAALQIAGNLSNAGTFELYDYSNGGASSASVGGTLNNTADVVVQNYNTSGTTILTVAGVVNGGTLDLVGSVSGSVTYQAVLDVTAQAAPAVLTGLIELSGPSLLEFTGGSFISIAPTAELLLNGPGALVADAGSTGSNSALTGLSSNAGSLFLEDGGTLQTSGDFNNTGTLEIDDYYGSGTSTLAIGGTLDNTGSVSVYNYYTPGTSTLTAIALGNTGTINLTGTESGTIVYQATLDITAGTAPAVETGTLNLSGPALVEFAAGGISGIAQGGEIILNGSGSRIADANDTSSSSALTGLASNAGYLYLENGAALQIAGNLQNSNYLEIYDYAANAISNVSIGGTLDNSGTVFIENYYTSGTTTAQVAGLVNSGSVDVYGVAGGYQATLNVTGAFVDTGVINLSGDGVLSAGSLTVSGGGALYVYGGGVAGAPLVGSGGYEYLYSGGVSTEATIAGGILEMAGGTVSAATIAFTDRGGVLQIDGTAMPSNTIVDFRQTDTIDLRGAAFSSSDTGSIGAGNLLTVSGGGGTYTLQLDPLHNYTSAAIVLTSDGAGGTDVTVVTPPIFVSSGQTLTISSGITDDNVNVLGGGTLVVQPGGTATDTIDAGTENLGGVDLNGTVVGGGTLIIGVGAVASNTVVSGGNASVASGGYIGDSTIAGGTLALSAGAVVSGTILFAGGGTLEIDGTTMPTNPISGFVGGDTIDLRALAWSSTNSVTVDAVTNTLTVTGGGTTDVLAVGGVPLGTQLVVMSDGFGGTQIGTFQNTGTLSGSYLFGVVLSDAATQNPTTLTTSGYVTNRSTTHGGDAVYGTNAAAWSFSNYGSIATSGSAAADVALALGGTVVNEGSGVIRGSSDGIFIGGAVGVVRNFGIISAGGGSSGGLALGVFLAAGGSVTNASGGVIVGSTDGIAITSGGGAVANYGTIAGGGVYLIDGGSVTNNLGGVIDGAVQGVAIGHATGTVVNAGGIAGTGGNSGGVYLTAGGSVTNASTGTIDGTSDGIVIGDNTGTAGATGRVSNLGAVAASGTASTGIFLVTGGLVVNGQSGSNLGTVTAGGDGVVIGSAAAGAGTAVNYGYIGGANLGVWLDAGGSVTNGAGATIASQGDAVFVQNAAGTVVNRGTIVQTGTAGFNAVFVSTGSVENYGLVSAAGSNAAAIHFGGAGTVANFGAVSAAGGSNANDFGVFLGAGGTVDNGAGSGSSASIVGYHIGIIAGGTAGVPAATVLNFGTIESTQIGVVGTAGFTGVAVLLQQGGSIGNYGLISSQENGVSTGGTAGGVGTVTNLGTIAAYDSVTVFGTTTLYPSAVFLGAGGIVTNGRSGSSAGLIQSGWNGVVFENTAGTVVNFGTIRSTGSILSPGGFHSNPVILGSGGTLLNGASGATGALIEGYERAVYIGGDRGIPIAGATGTIVNWGTIDSQGTGSAAVSDIRMAAGGIVTNYGLIASPAQSAISIGSTLAAGAVAGTVVNFGTIAANGTGTAGVAVYLGFGGIVTNSGLISGAHPGTPASGGTGGYPGVIEAKNQAATVVNLGTITNPNNSNGINLLDGGLVINGPAGAGLALISALHTGIYIGGTSGVPTPGAVGTVVNYGTIENTTSLSSVISLVAGGTVINHGLIESPRTGVAFSHVAGTIVNFGSIVSTAPLSGTRGTGAYLGAGGVLLNAVGAVIAAYRSAVAIGNTAATTTPAVVSNYGRLTGAVGVSIGAADSAANTIVNFGTITGTSGTAIQLGTVASELVVIENGSVLQGAVANFRPGDTIDLAGLAFTGNGSAVLGAGNLLTVTEGGGSVAVQLDPLQSFAAQVFAVANDGTGGTDVTVLPPNTVLSGQTLVVSAGETLRNITVLGGGTIVVAAGGMVIDTRIDSGGAEVVNAGGIDVSATVFSGGFEDVFGSASGTMIFSGGSQTVESGGSAVGTVLDGVAVQTVFGFAGGTTVSAGDSQIVESGGVASGTTVLQGGSEIVLSGGLTSDTLIAGGLLELSAGATASGSIDLVGSGGVLQLDSNTMPTVTIGGLVLGDAIDLRGLAFTASNTLNFNAGTGVLKVIGGGTTDTLTLSGVPTGAVLGLSNDGHGDTLVAIRPASLFDFVFTYNDGKDYYYGTVADDGTYGYSVGQTINAGLGQYDIFNEEGLLPNPALPAGTVRVLGYSHGGPGQASTVPIATGNGTADGVTGLGSESDAVLGIDGQTHNFSNTVEANFGTVNTLFGFVFTYADGASFYSGTVADNGSFGVTVGTRTVTGSAGQVVGTYTVFADGQTTRAAGTVVVDRFTVGDAAFVPNSAGAVDGTGGLGSESDTITVNGTTVGFSDQQEPALTLSIATVPATPPPSTTDIITGELDATYNEVLGRNPTPTELTTGSNELAAGTTLAAIRTALAQSAEAQGDLSQLYNQIFDRNALSSELSTATTQLIDGASLASEELILAQSPEAQTDINQIYLDVLARNADGSGMTSAMAALASGTDLNGVLSIVAHSPEAQSDLIALFQGIIGRAPGAAELVGMEDQLTVSGTTQTTLQTALTNTGSAGGYATVTATTGSTTLTALSGTPTLFVFGNIAFGNDTVAGFDPTRDTIELPKAIVANLTTLNSETSSTAGGALITLNSTQSVLISGVAPASLGSANFLFV